MIQTIQTKDTKIIQDYLGVDISNFNCMELKPDPIYAKYNKEDLHYIIGTQQKGLKSYTQKGLKRIKKKNIKKNCQRWISSPNKIKPIIPSSSVIRRTRRPRSPRIFSQNISQKVQDSVKQLNPKSPQQIVMKALRTQFRNKLQKNHLKKQEPGNNILISIKQSLKTIGLLRKPQRSSRYKRATNNKQDIALQQNQIKKNLSKLDKICPKQKNKIEARLRRKQNQIKRRKQLTQLTEKYRPQLSLYFGERMYGDYGKCPKISRKQIKEFLGLKDVKPTNTQHNYKMQLEQAQFPSLLGVNK